MNKQLLAGLLTAILCGTAYAQAPSEPQQNPPKQTQQAPAPLTAVESLELRIAAQESLIRESRLVIAQLEKQLDEARKIASTQGPYKTAEAKIRAAHGYGSDVKIVFDNKGNPEAVRQ